MTSHAHEEMPQRENVPNVILFGEAGSGKSSIVNMLDESQKAFTSSSAVGATSKFTCHQMTLEGRQVNLYDTIGLNEGFAGTVSIDNSIAQIWEFLNSLKYGVSLLVYVMKGRITDLGPKNYKMIYDIFCDRRVPIIMLKTYMENEDDVNEWWTRNKPHFDNYGMDFEGHACITAIRGKNGRYKAEYERSKLEVANLIVSHCSKAPWTMDQEPWFQRVILGFIKYRVIDSHDKRLCRALILYGMTKQQAREFVTRAKERRKEHERAAKKEARERGRQKQDRNHGGDRHSDSGSWVQS